MTARSGSWCHQTWIKRTCRPAISWQGLEQICEQFCEWQGTTVAVGLSESVNCCQIQEELASKGLNSFDCTVHISVSLKLCIGFLFVCIAILYTGNLRSVCVKSPCTMQDVVCTFLVHVPYSVTGPRHSVLDCIEPLLLVNIEN